MNNKVNFNILIIYLLLINSCTEHSYNKVAKDIQFKCFCKPFEDADVNIAHILDFYEKSLIEEKVLVDKTGKSYRDFLKNVVNSNELATKVYSDSLGPLYSKVYFITNFNDYLVEESSKNGKMRYLSHTNPQATSLSKLIPTN